MHILTHYINTPSLTSIYAHTVIYKHKYTILGEGVLPCFSFVSD